MSLGRPEPAGPGDLDAIAAIDAHSLRTRAARASYSSELSREFARLLVVRDEIGVAAFIDYWLVSDEAHLLALATRADATRRGHARRLVDHMLSEARSRDCRHATLEVRPSNRAAIELYDSIGFQTVGVRAKYYADGDEDALVMLLALDV